MAQFDVHRNTHAPSAGSFPFLLNVQSDLLSGLASRMVVPLAKLEVVGSKPIKDLNPLFIVEGESLVMLTQEMAGIGLKQLGPAVCNLADQRQDIVRALDIVFSGI